MRLDRSCPFCGEGKQVATSSVLSVKTGKTQFVVVCNRCGAHGPVQDSLNEAIDAWTVRTPKAIWERLGEEGEVTP